MKKKSITLIMALTLIVGGIIGGSVAWLLDRTDPVVNTFTTSDISIELTEKEGGNFKEFKMIPGHTITKDPKVTVKANSEHCYLFVKLDKSVNFDLFMTYVMLGEWTVLSNNPGVYYREVELSTDEQTFAILKDNKVTVIDSVTKSMMNSISKSNNNLPQLTVTAYATQFYKTNNEKFNVEEAWTILNP